MIRVSKQFVTSNKIYQLHILGYACVLVASCTMHTFEIALYKDVFIFNNISCIFYSTYKWEKIIWYVQNFQNGHGTKTKIEIFLSVKQKLFWQGYRKETWHSSFSQTYKVGNVGIIANFVFPYICSFHLYL